jgi:NAD(P)H dehydrogenase (quinone)
VTGICPAEPFETANVPVCAADMLMSHDIAARNGKFATIGPTLERVLGRPPISMRDLIAEKIGR